MNGRLAGWTMDGWNGWSDRNKRRAKYLLAENTAGEVLPPPISL